MTSIKKLDTINDITLHEAIKRVINEYGPAEVAEITARVNVILAVHIRYILIWKIKQHPIKTLKADMRL